MSPTFCCFSHSCNQHSGWGSCASAWAIAEMLSEPLVQTAEPRGRHLSYSHPSHRKTVLLLLPTPNLKPCVGNTRGKGSFAVTCVRTMCYTKHYHCCCEAHAHLSSVHAKETQWAALPMHDSPATCPLYLISHFALSSAFLNLASWWYYSSDAYSNLCFSPRQNCPFHWGTVNVVWLFIMMNNWRSRAVFPSTSQGNPVFLANVPNKQMCLY